MLNFRYVKVEIYIRYASRDVQINGYTRLEFEGRGIGWKLKFGSNKHVLYYETIM